MECSTYNQNSENPRNSYESIVKYVCERAERSSNTGMPLGWAGRAGEKDRWVRDRYGGHAYRMRGGRGRGLVEGKAWQEYDSRLQAHSSHPGSQGSPVSWPAL